MELKSQIEMLINSSFIMGAAPINFSSGEQEYVMIWQEQKKRNAQFLTYRELCIFVNKYF